ncbi:biopolymer transporter ExbD [Pseudorhodobacter turbinis]|uniref:Biopolymer transporter ExbD n=1 Tax=Pseudorhodobacter turbinis TaxID=2500533 RepID=A0A4P8EEC1_9RHOB|nr:biopolymer transporter ExbD [Pseudorhodobacter turbinis]QCO54745.1 biopolymer transporter ExbD [Pseudorhodobacter turbinis]
MDFSTQTPKRKEDNLLPMINVVFLLLIFFLISAKMTPPEPFPVTPPTAQAEAEAEGAFTLYLAADGRIGFHDTEGDAALEMLETALTDYCDQTDCDTAKPRLTLRGDTALPAEKLAAILPRISALGFAQIELVAQSGGTP